ACRLRQNHHHYAQASDLRRHGLTSLLPVGLPTRRPVRLGVNTDETAWWVEWISVSSLSPGRASIGRMSPAALDRFSDLTRTWFQDAFPSPTPAQDGAWEAIASGEDALVVAPTGSGKTLAAFLWALDRLATDPVPDERERLR